MKRVLLMIGSHLFVIGAGVLLAMLFTSNSEEKPSLGGSSISERKDGVNSRGAASSKRERAVIRSEEVVRQPGASLFRKAWDALPDQRLTSKERLQAQRKLLAEWAKVDLEGAMEAALGEAWDFGGFDNYTMGPYATAFEKVFAENPMRSWELIQSGKFGLGASMFRNAWYQAMGRGNPSALVGVLSEISWRDRGKVLSSIEHASRRNPELRAEVLAQLKSLPAGELKASEFAPFLEELQKDEALARFAEVKELETLEGKMQLMQLGQALRKDFDQKRTLEGAQELISELAAVSPEARGKLVMGLLVGFGNGGRHRPSGEESLVLIDSLIADEQWHLVGNRKLEEVLRNSIRVSNEDRAAWAVNLPQRKETTELFHRAIDRYVESNLDEAWGWIQDFPPGLWRDRALGEYATQVLRVRRDYEASHQALDAISDPKVRKVAASWRPQWAKDQDKERE